jgi:hypothetical protein
MVRSRSSCAYGFRNAGTSRYPSERPSAPYPEAKAKGMPRSRRMSATGKDFVPAKLISRTAKSMSLLRGKLLRHVDTRGLTDDLMPESVNRSSRCNASRTSSSTIRTRFAVCPVNRFARCFLTVGHWSIDRADDAGRFIGNAYLSAQFRRQHPLDQREPNPLRVGGMTGGPPLSVHRKESRRSLPSPTSCQVIETGHPQMKARRISRRSWPVRATPLQSRARRSAPAKGVDLRSGSGSIPPE